MNVNRYSGSTRKMFLESKVLDLLRLSIEHCHNKKTVVPVLREADLNLVRDVHNYIHLNIDEDLNLMELAHKAGINDHKLNAGFKHLYGTTVVSFVIDLRLDLAKTIITETSLPLKFIAVKVGYANISAFSTAFKKKFGFPPSEIKRNHY